MAGGDSSKLAFTVICQLAAQLSVKFFGRSRVVQRRGERGVFVIAGLRKWNVHTQRLVVLAAEGLTKHLTVTASAEARSGHTHATLGPCQILAFNMQGARNESLCGNLKQETQDNAL